MKKQILGLLAAALLLASCGNQQTANAAASLKGQSFETNEDGVAITLAFDAEKDVAYGKVANRYSAPYEIDGGKIAFKQMVSTMMMPFGNADKVERDYFKFLPEARTYRFDGQTLTLKAADGSERAFKKIN